MLQKSIIIFFVFLVSACVSKPEKNSVRPEITTCPEQRSQICTREYLPVCATRDTGIRCITAPCPSTEEKTYGNGCTACADVKVINYRAGACKQEADKKLQ